VPVRKSKIITTTNTRGFVRNCQCTVNFYRCTLLTRRCKIQKTNIQQYKYHTCHTTEVINTNCCGQPTTAHNTRRLNKSSQYRARGHVEFSLSASLSWGQEVLLHWCCMTVLITPKLFVFREYVSV